MGILFVLLLAIVVLAIIGGWVMGLLVHLAWWVLIGLVIGALARLVLSGSRPIGPITTVLAGIGGSLLGGVLARVFSVGWILEFIIAILVAAVIIAVVDRSDPGARI